MSTENCPDCGAAPDEFHRPECDTERCPRCGGQAASCGHGVESIPPGDRLPRAGRWPGGDEPAQPPGAGPRSPRGTCMVRNNDPTPEQWGAYTRAWAWFNDRLFDGELAACILNFSRKASRTLGFFAPGRWEKDARVVPEISLNPDHLDRPLAESMSTLVHEMAHQWQHQFGTPSRGGYHNREWGARMKAVGLHPSATGQPGGRETGQQVSHFVVPGGPFEAAFAAMPGAYGIPWASGAAGAKPGPGRPGSKVRFTCPGCGANAWGKPGLLIKCQPCDLDMAG